MSDLPEESVEELARQIRVQLADKKLKAKDLAEKLKKSPQWVSQLMNPNQITGKQLQALEVLKNWDSIEPLQGEATK